MRNLFSCGNIIRALLFPAMSDEMLTTEEAAAALGVTPSRVRQLVRGGALPASRFGKAHLIRRGDLRLVEDRPTVGRPPKAGRKSVSGSPQEEEAA